MFCVIPRPDLLVTCCAAQVVHIVGVPVVYAQMPGGSWIDCAVVKICLLPCRGHELLKATC